MTTDQNKVNSQNTQSVNSQLSDLLNDAKNLNQEIDETNSEARKSMDDIDVEVDKSINNLEKIYSDLDQIEKDAGDELDKLVLQHAEDLANE
jgi:DNA repair ATPase RecN|tara:strand:- start:466 stop:741 length:276 start_codon:yes stop_codon:yes gene_type:complete